MQSIGLRTALLTALSLTLRAATLSPPTTLAQCVDVVVVDDPTTCSLSRNDAFASGSVTLSPFVSLTAHAESAPIGPIFYPSASAFLVANYYFQVLGGSPGDGVPILITTNLTTSGSPNGYGFSEIIVSTSFGGASALACHNGLCGDAGTAFSGTLSTNTRSGEGDTVHLEIEASSGGSFNSEFADASADPFIFVDPSFAGAANYSIAFPNPEPSH